MATKRVRFKEDEARTPNLHELKPNAVYGAVLLVLGCGLLAAHLATRLPAALTVADLERTHPAGALFIAERAWASLKTLNDIGPKPAGSQANEVMAHEFLLKELDSIVATAHRSQQLELDQQTVTGAFSTSLLNQSMTSVYRNVQNVVVRLAGTDTGAGLLLNCHFDTVASSPGASDDGASCAVMLEVLRVLSRSPERTRHPVIFLFNGAEETMLQAAHGFVTQHRWAEEVRAFLNLESSGSGGKEVLFQAGPHHPWLIEVYARAIRHPFAHSVGEEIFQLGLIPSDTDFRMFRDYGEVPGMDFAHIANGYRYHTRYDSMDFLSLEVLQRTGDNVLSLAHALANSDELAAEHRPTGETVFFDFLGLGFVHYGVATGRLINASVALLGLLVPLVGLVRGHRTGAYRDILREVLFGLVATVLGTVFSIVSCTTIARQLDFVGKPMSWYTNTYLILGLYCCPALLAHCFVYMFLSTFYSNSKSELSLGQMTQARLGGVNVFWSIITLASTAAGYRSGYITMVLLAFSLASSSVNGLLLRTGRSRRTWIAIHLAFQVPALLWSTNFYNVLIQLFVPITGRFGGSRNPEIFISLLAASGTLLCCSYLLPFIGQLRSPMNFTAKLSALTVLSIVLACFSPLGVPYRDESMGSSPTPQRHYVTHTFRAFHDEQGLFRSSDSGYLFQEMDRNTRQTVEEFVALGKPLTPLRQLDSCREMLFCAAPFYSLWHQMRFNNYWLPGPEPAFDNMVTMAYLATEQLNERTQRLTFAMDASIQSSIIIGPKEGVRLVGWSLLDHVPPPAKYAGREGHFVFITHGLAGSAWNVTLDLQADQPKEPGQLLDIMVTTKFWEYHHMHTPDFEDLLAQFPSWAHVVPSVAVVSVFSL